MDGAADSLSGTTASTAEDTLLLIFSLGSVLVVLLRPEAVTPLLLLGALAAAALLRRRYGLLSWCGVLLLWFGVPRALPETGPWPGKVIAVGLFLLLCRVVPSFRRDAVWLRTGRHNGTDLALAVLLFALSALALPLWAERAGPALSAPAAHIPAWPWPLLVPAALFFAVTNAAAEEVVFRGVLMHRLGGLPATAPFANLVQALLFGAIHAGGDSVPNGAAGVALTFVYGLLAGILRKRTGGLVVPWLAHTGSDAVVFLLLAAKG